MGPPGYAGGNEFRPHAVKGGAVLQWGLPATPGAIIWCTLRGRERCGLQWGLPATPGAIRPTTRHGTWAGGFNGASRLRRGQFQDHNWWRPVGRKLQWGLPATPGAIWNDWSSHKLPFVLQWGLPATPGAMRPTRARIPAWPTCFNGASRLRRGQSAGMVRRIPKDYELQWGLPATPGAIRGHEHRFCHQNCFNGASRLRRGQSSSR